MTKSDNNLEQSLKKWREGKASVEEIRSLAADLGNQHFVAGVSDLVQLMDHSDEIVRDNAINSLAFEFHYVPAVGKLVTMLAEDPDEDVRRVAAAALGGLSHNSGDRGVLTVLANAALNDPDEYVRSSAYKALQIVNGVSRDEHLRILRDQSLSVDPMRVQVIMAESR